jgi:hypothetical protein
MNLADFRTRFPEFDLASDTYVQAYLTDALLELDAVVWGALLDLGQAYLAAHRMASSPWGQSAKLISEDGSTTYWKNYENLRRACTPSVAVLDDHTSTNVLPYWPFINDTGL